MAEYKKTLNLPDTKFPMKANLTQQEPETLKFWDSIDACTLMQDTSGQKGRYILHDGPPYANGNIHLGTALNKVLKDIVVKSHNFLGYAASYVPGWDCHGLPIEHKVELDLGEKKNALPPQVVRKKCRAYAQKYMEIQRKEFQRLGVFGVWDKPYLTMAPDYEATTAKELANFVEKGNVVRSKKPIYWCSSCQTALAEAEVEYADHTSDSIYVAFPLNDPKLAEVLPETALLPAAPTFAIIWTTTPWTLPDNMAICLHPEFEYVLVQVEAVTEKSLAKPGARYLVAADLYEKCAKIFGWAQSSIIANALGAHLEGLVAHHPFYDRPSPLTLGEHVTLDAGTGLVHTAPGHGREDYEVGLQYNLDVYSPLDDEGRFLESVPFFAGMQVFEANPKVIEKLKEVGLLLAAHTISHSYPHCWRCKSPVIFRATTQWFIRMDINSLRANTLKAIREKVEWIPAWGEERIYSMIETRPDWCISRQRMWGVPIVALLCESCGEAWNDPNWMRDIASRFSTHPRGCDYWYETDLAEIVPSGLVCPHCGAQKWKKETDILDVWFDSGSSFAAVAEKRPEMGFPVDLYLEGSDQHRGWFHSSLLISMGTRGIPPYKAVLTHGYVVDKDGNKQSKSLGNVVAPEEVITKYGAELLRLWVSSVDYKEDIRYSSEIMDRLVDAYRRIRNTCRYILGNIHDIDRSQLVPFTDMLPLDRYALSNAAATLARVEEAYATYEFHKVYHALHGLCATDLSAFYLDILKDRLYSSLPESKERRSAQSALYGILLLLLKGMAPVLSFTAEEVFQTLPEGLRPLNAKGGEPIASVFALPAVKLDYPAELPEKEAAVWAKVLTVRSEITKAVEPLRKDGLIGHSLDTRVTLFASENLKEMLAKMDMRAICIVSQFTILPLAKAPVDAFYPTLEEGEEEFALFVEKAHGEKCERCWIYDEHLGANPQFPTVCPRCAAVLADLEKTGRLPQEAAS